MKVPFVDLKIQYRNLKKDLDRAIREVFAKSQFVQGQEVSLFEKEFAKYLGVKHCIAVNSGTDALILGFRALNLSPGDEVIVPVRTYIATAIGASENGLRPVFVDMDPKDSGMDLTDLKKKISPKTRAIIAVHLFGQPEKIDEIKKIIQASGRKIHLIEDACQAHGAEFHGKKVGTFGIFAAFSFYPGKNLGAYGDGGAVTTNSAALARNIRLLREYGQRKKYVHDTIGVNSRLDTLQAAILRTKLPHLAAWNATRQTWAQYYSERLRGIVKKTPPYFADRTSVFHLYVVEVPRRNALIKELKKQGIVTLIHYPTPLHMQKAYKYLGYKKGDFPEAEKASRRIVSLPMYPDLTKKQVDFVIQTIQKFYAKKL